MFNWKSQANYDRAWWAEKTFLGITKNEAALIVAVAIAMVSFWTIVNYMGIDRILGIR